MVRGWVAITSSSHSLLHTHTLIYPIASPLSLMRFIMAIFYSALHTFSDLGWGLTPMRFVFINWISEHCEHCVILRLFFLTSLPVSFLLHFASSLSFPLRFISILKFLFTFIFPLCDADTLMSRSYRLGWLHPSFHP